MGARAMREERRTREIKFTCQMLTMDGIEDQNVAHSQIAALSLSRARLLSLIVALFAGSNCSRNFARVSGAEPTFVNENENT